jgi:Zn-dependent M28 family amino/carboxypeptidase
MSYFILFLLLAFSFHIVYADMGPKEDDLKNHVRYLSDEIGERHMGAYENLQAAAQYIKERYTSYGYQPGIHSYTIQGKRCENVAAVKKGTETPDEIIVIGAHYDAVWGSPGADDNASAVASLLELARLFSTVTTKRTVRFVAFPNEEPPFFLTGDMGSRRYAKEVREKGENIIAMVCLESLGYYSDKRRSQNYPPIFNLFYPDTANFIAIVGNFSSRALVGRVKGAFRRGTDFPVESVVTFSFVPGVDFSDHGSFWKYGYKAVMVTDTAFYRNPYYHTPGDTYEKLNYSALADVTEGLANVIRELANRPR